MNDKKKINTMLFVLLGLFIIAVVIIVADPTQKPNQFVYNGFVVSRFRIPSAPDVVFHSVDLSVGNKLYNVPFRNNPQDLEDIRVTGLDGIAWLTEVEESNNYDILADNVFITFDPTQLDGSDTIIAGGTLVRAFGSGQGGIYHKQVSGAFTKAINGSSTQVVTCDDASQEQGVVMLRLGEEDRVYTINDCILVEGITYDGLIMSSEKLLLTLLGVVNV